METVNFSEYQRLVVIDVDVQDDFCPDGSLPVTDGDLVVPALNRAWKGVKKYAGDRVRLYPYAHREDLDYTEPTALQVASRDWHPLKTKHFGSPPDFDTTWPVHCVAGTKGASFHKDLDLSNAAIFSKGTLPDEDAYSAFQAKDVFGEKLEDIIGNPNRLRIALFIGGLATDFCVKATVLDARQKGYDTFVLSDAIRGVAPETSERAIQEMKNAGAQFIDTDQLVETLGV